MTAPIKTLHGQIKNGDVVKEVLRWKSQYGGRINEQIRGMGASLDWNREFFTLDDARSEAVIDRATVLAVLRSSADAMIPRL